MGLLGLVGLVLAVASPVAEAGVKLESASPPMLDGTPTLLAGEPFEPCVVLEGGVAMKLIKIEDFGAEQSNGPAFARVTYAQGRDQVVEDVAYWRLAIPRADSIAALADVSVVETVDGGLTVTASLAHRTDRAIGAVDHGTLSLVVMDRSSGASVRLSTWGEWIEGEGGLMEYATLSSAVNCVSLSDFTGDVPPGSPIIGALTGRGDGGDEGGADLIWILQGQGLDGDFNFSTWGDLVESPTALDDVKAYADEAGWTTEPIEKPEPSACSFGGWTIPPVQPCIWTVQPAPDNPPPTVQTGSGAQTTLTWSGLWSHAGVASSSGARLSKSQLQDAGFFDLAFDVWSPGPPFDRTWAGKLLVDRSGECGECPCEALATAFPSSRLDASLDANATVFAKLAASITANGKTSSTQALLNVSFISNAAMAFGANEGSVTIADGGRGKKLFVDNAISTPGPLHELVVCGSLLLVQSSFAASGSTHLSALTDFPWRPHADFHVEGSAGVNLSLAPVAPPSGSCGLFAPVVLEWDDPYFPD